MSGLFASLNQSAHALTAQSLGVEVAGRNLANANNPAYARQRVVFVDHNASDPSGASQSLGLQAESVQQLRDSLLDQQVVREAGLTASLTAEDATNATIQTALGQTIDSTGATTGATGQTLGDAVSTLLNGFQALAATPTDLGTRQNLLQNAADLAQRFNDVDGRLGQIQTDLGSQLTGDVSSVNNLLTNIATLNAQIGRAEINSPGSAVDLRDQRQADLEQLAGKLSIETRPSAGGAGQVDVFVRDTGGAPIDLVSLGTVTNAVAFDGTQFTAGTAATPIALAGGEAKGLLAARDGTVQTLRDQLNRFAGQIATSVNAAYNPTGATGNLFQFTPGSAAATIALAPGLTPAGLKASDTANPGDNTIALAVANLSAQSFSTAGGDLVDGTFSQYYSGVINHLGNTVAQASSNLTDQTNVEKLVRQQRDSVSGVSLDEEMTNLMQYQRAYQASSRVITIIDGLLDNVINSMGKA